MDKMSITVLPTFNKKKKEEKANPTARQQRKGFLPNDSEKCVIKMGAELSGKTLKTTLFH